MTPCALCAGSGKNTTRIRMSANNRLCPRCGGYGTVTGSCANPPTVTAQDRVYIRANGWLPRRRSP